LIVGTVSGTVALPAAVKHPETALDRVPRFLEQIQKAGFSTQEGSFTYFDLIKEVCPGEGAYFSAMGNNPWPNAYFVLYCRCRTRMT